MGDGLFGRTDLGVGAPAAQIPETQRGQVPKLWTRTATAGSAGFAQQIEVVGHEPAGSVREVFEHRGTDVRVTWAIDGLSDIVEERGCKQLGVGGLPGGVLIDLETVEERIPLGVVPGVLANAVEIFEQREEFFVHGVGGPDARSGSGHGRMCTALSLSPILHPPDSQACARASDD